MSRMFACRSPYRPTSWPSVTCCCCPPLLRSRSLFFSSFVRSSRMRKRCCGPPPPPLLESTDSAFEALWLPLLRSVFDLRNARFGSLPEKKEGKKKVAAAESDLLFGLGVFLEKSVDVPTGILLPLAPNFGLAWTVAVACCCFAELAEPKLPTEMTESLLFEVAALEEAQEPRPESASAAAAEPDDCDSQNFL
ncbi:hypothetical protein TYRP_003957 [Tyrophagus putrescentiae]|nr:hypothetical protein TYRP_003957 [Tyrophagus putrescentiae]